MSLDLQRDQVAARALRVGVDPARPAPGILLDAAHIIRQGGVLAYPTETFYGLAADPESAGAIARLFKLKGRDGMRALILLVARAEQAHDLALISGATLRWFEKLAAAFWPGPLTLVLPARPARHRPALAGGETVAIRMSSHPVALQLTRAVGGPITSTSANPSGGLPATRADGIDPALAAGLDLILDAGPTPGGKASTLLDLSGSRPAILRDGPISQDQIASILLVRPVSPATVA